MAEQEFIATGRIISSARRRDLVDLRILRRHVYVGVSMSDTLEATMMSAAVANPATIRVGARVLVWGFHNPDDGLRRWCQIALHSIGLGGYVFTAPRCIECTPGPARTLIREAVLKAECAHGALASRVRRQNAIADVMICTVDGKTRTGSGDAWLRCSRIDAIASSGAALNVAVHVAYSRTWWPDIAVGDTLAIPRTRSEVQSSTVDIAESPNWFKSQRGLVQYFGCPLSEIDKALEPGKGKGLLKLRSKSASTR